MKALFIGLGSAGQRHLRNLKQLMHEESLELSAYRVGGLSRMLNHDMQIVEGQDVCQANQIKEFYHLEEALAEKPDIAIIANPNSKHMECAIAAARAGCDLFIEKPLSSQMDGVEMLQSIVQEKKLIAYVGYQNRLHPCVRKMKEVVASGVLGSILSVYCEVGELLTCMHPYDEDYQKMSEAQASMGGGVILCQIHELDYLFWIFGIPVEVYAIGGKNSDMVINV